MDEEIYFEITNGWDIVRIDSFKSPFSGVDNEDWDKNFLRTKVSVQGGVFRGEYDAGFMTIDFEKFKQDLKRIYNDLKGYATFSCLDHYLEFKIKGDGIGHFSLGIAANDNASGSKLEFQMTFDQTQIPELVRQLDTITKAFPTFGSGFNVKGESLQK